ncbi:hypothetical protein ACS0TY_002781 [Phlomoides rotata]
MILKLKAQNLLGTTGGKANGKSLKNWTDFSLIKIGQIPSRMQRPSTLAFIYGSDHRAVKFTLNKRCSNPKPPTQKFFYFENK